MNMTVDVQTMKTPPRPLLKRVLIPAAYHRAGYFWWYIQVYTLRRIAAKFKRQLPVVHGQPSDLVERIKRVNALASTPMCRVMTRHGSDKGRFKHNYTTV